MTTAVTIAEFRKDLRRLMDIALTGREIVCLDAKSKDRQTCSLIKTKLLLDMLKAYSFQPEVHNDKETKTHNIHLDKLKLYAYVLSASLIDGKFETGNGGGYPSVQ